MHTTYLLRTIYAFFALSSAVSLAQDSLFAPNPPLAASQLVDRHDHYIGPVRAGSERLEIPSTPAETIITVNSMTPLLASTSPGSASSPSLTTSVQSPASTAEHDHHHSRLPAKLEIDETEILKTHAFDPPSYYDLDQTEEGMKGVMVAHMVIMSMAFFVFLALTIFLKSGGSSLSILPQFAFLFCSLVGLVLGRIYSWSTPSRYEHSSHKLIGYLTMVLTVGLNLVDVGRFALRSNCCGRLTERLFGILGGFNTKRRRHEHNETIFKYGDAEEERQGLVESPLLECSPHAASDHDSSASSSRGNSSTFSDSDTIYDSAGQFHFPKSNSTRAQLLDFALDLSMCLLVLLAYIELFNGVATYYGFCRGNYLNGCLAHAIKGSIFFWYGVLTFARYCGGMSKLGWAWNRTPSGERTIFTAEFVESFVIFLYGSTNTWMERWGKSGAYSVKDVQHVSIAVMFWAAGALGMLLESRTIRDWLATPAVQASNQDFIRIAQPASSTFSFNPFPALVVGVTGIAMSAHHQTYQFQVEIHALWGYLLALFALFRFLTYFFLYLRPPASILPSRPPTEALASLFLTCGGVVFVFSTEQITFAAMRHQADDVMALLNVTVAFVCTVLLWITLLFGIKGWALKRSLSRRLSQSSPVKSA